MSFFPIVPALIPRSREEVISYAEQFSFSPEFHLDLVDGQFVPDISWPYEPHGEAISATLVLDL